MTPGWRPPGWRDSVQIQQHRGIELKTRWVWKEPVVRCGATDAAIDHKLAKGGENKAKNGSQCTST